MTGMGFRSKWRYAPVALLAGAGLVVAGCSSDSAPDRAEMLEGTPVAEAVVQAGGDCGEPGPGGRTVCDLDGVVFDLAEGAWLTTAGQRERECAAEAVGADLEVLTNGSWMIQTDDLDELDSVRAVLADNGAPSRTEEYCADPEWAEE